MSDISVSLSSISPAVGKGCVPIKGRQICLFRVHISMCAVDLSLYVCLWRLWFWHHCQRYWRMTRVLGGSWENSPGGCGNTMMKKDLSNRLNSSICHLNHLQGLLLKHFRLCLHSSAVQPHRVSRWVDCAHSLLKTHLCKNWTGCSTYHKHLLPRTQPSETAK